MNAVAQKKGLTFKDLDLLAFVRNGISEVLHQLKECDVCGAAVTEIARLEIEGVRANVCSACGISALKNKQLKLRKKGTKPSPGTRKKSVRPKKVKGKMSRIKKKVAHEKKKVVASIQESLPLEISKPVNESSRSSKDEFSALSQEIGAKVGTIRRIQKIASDIAMPMSFEGTFNFTRAEARKENLKLDDGQLRMILRQLVDKFALRIRQ